MSPRDPERVQLDFPQLTADLIRQLNLTGTLGLLDFLTEVRPVYIVAQRAGALEVTTTPITFTSASIFDGDVALPAANTVIADTGALPSGIYDLLVQMEFQGRVNLNEGFVRLQHRNAANAATLATLARLTVTASVLMQSVVLPLIGYEIATNERVRVLSPNLALTQGGVTGTIFMQIRPTP